LSRGRIKKVMISHKGDSEGLSFSAGARKEYQISKIKKENDKSKFK
jgi:hypothetical protein